MPSVRLIPRFESARKKFVKRNDHLSQRIEETLIRFITNPQHPSLHLEKLAGTSYWTIRIDQGNRLFFVWSDTGDTAIFFLVGPHDMYKKLGR